MEFIHIYQLIFLVDLQDLVIYPMKKNIMINQDLFIHFISSKLSQRFTDFVNNENLHEFIRLNTTVEDVYKMKILGNGSLV